MVVHVGECADVSVISHSIMCEYKFSKNPNMDMNRVLVLDCILHHNGKKKTQLLLRAPAD